MLNNANVKYCDENNRWLMINIDLIIITYKNNLLPNKYASSIIIIHK